jgi:hypothetical protein
MITGRLHFAGDWNFYCQWPIFRHMITHFQELAFRILISIQLESFQYGPICIHEDYRAKGLINPFFEFMKRNVEEVSTGANIYQ